MPDFSIEYHQQCAKSEFVTINGYEVSIVSGREWCTCPAFKYGKNRPCKHIKEAQEQDCGWHGAYFEKQSDYQKKNYICPRCGGPTEIVKVAV